MTERRTFEVQSRRHGTRIFRHVGTEPYQRLDGTMTTLSVWRCACVQCGTPFHIKTPANARSSKAFGVVHCSEHRRPRRTERIRQPTAPAKQIHARQEPTQTDPHHPELNASIAPLI
jgi:hypothetical protein